MQNADREAVKPTTTAVLNNSHRTAVHHAMGLGVSSSGVGDIGFSQSSGSSTESDRVGRFPQQILSDDHSDSDDEKNSDNLWKFEHARILAEKASLERSVNRKAKGRLKLNLVRRGASPQIEDEDDAFRNKSSELTRMMSDDDDEDNDQNDLDQINDAILLPKDGDMEAVRLMLKQNSDANGTSEGDSYLCLAAATGSHDVCQVLLSCGANVDDRGSKGDCTPLMEAASVGDKRVVQLLCEKGADVNAKSLTGNTPLHFAACNGNDDVILTLLEFGASVEEHNENGHTPLMEAANTGHISTVQLLLDAGAGINAHSNEFKETALTLAAYKGHVEMVDFLLKNGADVEHKTDEMHTALMEAAMDGHVSVAKQLIEAGAKVNMPDDSFESPLTLAASGGHTELAKLLISGGANIEEANDEGYTPLMEAVREGHLPLVQLLLSKGANPNAQTQTHETPLGFACKAGNTEVALYLINHDAVVDQEAEDGHTALMKAAKTGHLSTVEYLTSVGADINKLSRNNDSALSLACTYGFVDIVEHLLKNGANPVHRLQEGSTVIIEAAKGGHTEVVNLLLTYTNSIQYRQIIQDEQELSQSSPSQTSLDDQTSRVPMQGLGNVVPPQDPLFACTGTVYHDAQNNFSQLEKQYAGGDRRTDTCQQRGDDKVCGYHLGLSSCDDSSKLVLQSPQGSGYSSSDEDDEDDEDDDDGDDYEDDDEDDNGDGELSERDQIGKVEIKGMVTMSSAELPASLRKMLDGFQNMTLAEQMANKQLLFEKFPDLLRKDQIESFLHHSIAKQKNQNHLLTDAFPSSSDKTVKRSADRCTESPQKQMQNGFALMSGDQKVCAAKQAAAAVRDDQKMPSHGASCDCPHKKISTDNLISSNLKKKKSELQSTTLIHHAALNQWPGDDEMGQGTSARQQMPGTSARQQIQNRVFAKGNQKFGYDITQAQRKLLKHDHSVLQQFSCQRLQDVALHQCSSSGGSMVRGDDKSISSQEQLALQVYQNMALQQPLSLDIGQQQQLSDGCMGHFSSSSGGVENLYSQYHQAIKKLQDPYQQDLLLRQAQQQQQQHPSHQMLFGSDTLPLVSSPTGDCILLNSDMATRVGSIDKGAQTMLSQCQQPHLMPPQQQLLELSQAVDGLAKSSGNGVFDYLDPSSSRPLSPNASLSVVPGFNPLTEMVDVQTEVSHDSALSVACAGGFYDLASLLLSKGAKIELRDKKGLTPLLLAASAGFGNIVELLLNRGADIEAQSDRTKDTALSLACASGRLEVVELLLKRGANKEHRNVSDYTPLSQAASGGYLNIIRLLLNHSAEINSRTGSKLGISPLMLAAMNGHTESVIMLLENGSDINAQIETNRNTALTLACFQGRHEVVTVLAERKANLEHRAKTGLTPLMEAATGGYVEVGRVLLEKGADVAAAPVPTSRDTALTIAADKGHFRFVELLLKHGAPVDVKNKKGATALWLACNGGHLEVVQQLVEDGADVDSQDNRKVSCLVAAFRKGHTKVVKWLVKHVTQFPADQECARYIASITDVELLSRCKECSEIILSAKELQAEEAEKNADSLLQELQQEKSLVEKKRAAKERKREKKRQKKKEKTFSMKDSLRVLSEVNCGAKTNIDCVDGKGDDEFSDEGNGKKDTSEASADKNNLLKKDNKKGSKVRKPKSRSSADDDVAVAVADVASVVGTGCGVPPSMATNPVSVADACGKAKISSIVSVNLPLPQLPAAISSQSFASVADPNTRSKKEQGKSSRSFAVTGIGDLDDFCNPDDVKMPSLPNITTSNSLLTLRPEIKTLSSLSVVRSKPSVQSASVGTSKSSRSGTISNIARSTGNGAQKKGQRKDDNWKDASKKMRKIDVPARAVSRVIGRAGCNINAIREHSSARIDLDKLKTSDDAVVTIRGLPEQINQAAELVLGLIRESDKDIEQLIAALKMSSGQAVSSGTWKNTSKVANSTTSVWESGSLNVWENRSMRGGGGGGGGNTSQGATSSATALLIDSKSTNVWNRTGKEPTSLSELSVSASNVWDNSMADGIGVGTSSSMGTKPSAGCAVVGSNKLPLQLGKQDSLEQQRPGASDDYSKPQPIRSFPIGAWTPVRGHNAAVVPPERVIPFSSQQNPNVEVPSVPNGILSDVGAFSGTKAEPVNSATLVSEESAYDGGLKPAPILFSRSDSVEGRASDIGKLCSISSLATSFQASMPAPEKLLRQQYQEMNIGEYSPFNNHFSPLAETVIPKKVQSSSRVTFTDLSATRMGAVPNDGVVDMALQAKAPGYRPPGQLQRTVSSPGLTDSSSFQGEAKAALVSSDNDRNNMVTPPFNRVNERTHTPNIGDYSPFSDGIEKASKLVLQMNDGFCGVIPTPPKPDTYITTQSPMMLPRVSSNLNPDAPHFSSRPPVYKPQSSFEAASMFSSAPNYRPAMNMNMNMIQNHAGLAAFHAANGYIPNSVVKEHMMAQSLGFAGNAISSNNIEMMRRFSQDESSPSGPQMGPPVALSTSNPSSPNEEGLSNPATMGDVPFRLRPIGMERTNKRPASMNSSSGIMPNAIDLPPWTFTPGSADWQRQGYIGGAPMPLNVIPNLPPEGLIPQMSSSSHHPAMIGHLPVPQQKILAINNAMFDHSVQIRPSFLVPNGMALSFGGGGGAMGPGAMTHPPLQYPHLPPPSPAPERAAMDSTNSWTSAGLSMPDGVDGSVAACDEERLRAWNIWNGPSNL